ncbi:MAG: hypothetical protein EKK53_00070 [Burkholderiales bacterium]|nr:MAG: hypothetical protein EKK53_00070 [Burkholderiales bacterium]
MTPDLGPVLPNPLPRRALVLGAVAALAAPGAQATGTTRLEVVYPRMAERPVDAYPYRMIKAALEATGRPHVLRLTDGELPSMRAFRELGRGIFNVMDTGAAPRMAEEARILPFPLDLGLSGYRLMLVRRDRLPALRAVRTLDDLRRLRFGQGPDWVDSYILRASGLTVVEAEFRALFRMLEAGRFDVFPLGADEADLLLSRFGEQAPSAVVLPDWCLHYRFARVLVVRPSEAAVYDALQDGLGRIYGDGRAQAILARDPRIGPLLDGRRRLPGRIFELPNPQWATAYQAIPEHLFFKPPA